MKARAYRVKIAAIGIKNGARKALSKEPSILQMRGRAALMMQVNGLVPAANGGGQGESPCILSNSF